MTPATDQRRAGPFDWLVNTTSGRQTLVVVLVAIALIIGIVVAGSNKSNGSPSSNGQIFLTAADSPGVNAFTPSVAKNFAVGEATTTTAPTPASTVPGGVSSISGATVGLYGGTLNLSSCNVQQMIRYLTQNPALGQAWAAAEGIPYAGLTAYIDSLTPVILRADTQVTNHGYINGYANPIPEILQAGTAVLIDSYGVPRARCYCGNPLTPPVATSVPPTYVGTPWPTFSPTTVVVVVPAPAPLTSVTLVDTNTGQTFTRPVGTDGSLDNTPPPATSSSSSTTTIPAAVVENGPVYTLTGSNAQLSGDTTGLDLSQSDCTAVLNGDATTNASIVTSGTTIGIYFSNTILQGTYDPSTGKFMATGSIPDAATGVSEPVTMSGTLSSSAVTDAQVTETYAPLGPPGATCSFSLSGPRASTS